jgi:hypothetical protein
MEELIIDRIRQLLVVRRWYRTNRWSATWSEKRKAQDAELRALVRLVRQYRKAQRDPYPATMTYESWTHGEMAEAFGR